jgi:hypothetical protein
LKNKIMSMRDGGVLYTLLIGFIHSNADRITF